MANSPGMDARVRAQFMDAVADGALMTEGGVEALRETIENPPTRIPVFGLDDALHELPVAMTYIETLERAVLDSWAVYIQGQPFMLGCAHCASPATYRLRMSEYQHAPDCIVPALLAKYEERLND